MYHQLNPVRVEIRNEISSSNESINASVSLFPTTKTYRLNSIDFWCEHYRESFAVRRNLSVVHSEFGNAVTFDCKQTGACNWDAAAQDFAGIATARCPARALRDVWSSYAFKIFEKYTQLSDAPQSPTDVDRPSRASMSVMDNSSNSEMDTSLVN